MTGLPDETAKAAAALLGESIVGFEPRGGGYTLAITGLLHLADGRCVFLKAAAPGTPRDDPVVEDLVGEIAVLEAVATSTAAPHVPRVVASEATPLPLALLEDLSSASWPPPYPDDRLGIVDDAWLARALPSLAAAEAEVDLAGGDLVHGDLWYANLCVAERGPVIVDWGSAMRGNARLDRATVAWDLVVAGRDPGPLAFDGLAAWLALLTGNQAVQAVLPPGPGVDPASTLRADQAADIVAMLPHLARLLDLPPLPHTPGR